MKTQKLTTEAKESLIGRKIIDCGNDYIKLDNGLCIYLDESEVESIGSEPVSKSHQIKFHYKGSVHTFSFSTTDTDEWTAFTSYGITFDVHYDEDCGHIAVYEHTDKGGYEKTVYVDSWIFDKTYARRCDVCGSGMNAGYVLRGDKYCCSEKCLHTEVSDEEWKELTSDDESDSYYTEWDECDHEYKLADGKVIEIK